LSNRIDGDSTLTEFLNSQSFGTSINFRYLGIRTVTNATDVNYRWRPWIGFYASYRFSDRQIRTVESVALPAFPGAGERNQYEVNNRLHAGLGGVRIRPMKPLTFNLETEVGRADDPLTSIALRNYHTINGRADYRTKKLQLSTGYKQVYNLNPGIDIFNANNSHSRNYNANASWTLRNGLSFDLSYMKLHLDSTTGLAFFAATAVRPQLQTSFFSRYESNVHAANLGAHLSFLKRGDLYVGYAITKDTGGPRTAPAESIQTLLSSVQTFPMTYQTPLVRLSIRISPKVRWNAGYQFYNYEQQSNPFGFFQNFRANTGYTSVLWSF